MVLWTWLLGGKGMSFIFRQWLRLAVERHLSTRGWMPTPQHHIRRCGNTRPSTTVTRKETDKGLWCHLSECPESQLHLRSKHRGTSKPSDLMASTCVFLWPLSSLSPSVCLRIRLDNRAYGSPDFPLNCDRLFILCHRVQLSQNLHLSPCLWSQQNSTLFRLYCPKADP